MKQFFKFVFASMIGFFLANVIMTVVALFFVGIIVGVLSDADQPMDIPGENQFKILRIDLDGPIVERLRHRDIHFSEEVPIIGERLPLGLYELQRILKKAAQDETVKGVYIDAGDVEAGSATLTSLRRSLQEFKKGGKFIYAYGDRYNEANYYVSSVADAVFMYPQGDFELDGYAFVPAFFKQTLDKLEIEPLVFRAGAYKAAVEPFIRNDLSEENRLQLTELLADFWTVFKADVTAARELSEEELAEIAEKKLVSSAKQAKEHRLIDEVKYEDEVFDFLRGVIGVPKEEDVPFISSRAYGYRKDVKDPSSFIEIARGDGGLKAKRIAVIFAEGEIVEGRSRDDLMGSETLTELLREVRQDEDVKGVVLRVNSPGGSALASDEIWREVDLTNEKMPVVASLGDVAASGGYYIAAGAREIMAEPNTITGSIGVFGLSMVMKGFFNNKLGVSFDRVVTHPFADIGSFARPPTEAEREKIGQEIDRVYSRFLAVINEGRKIDIAELKKVAGGRVWSGTDALDVKLADRIGGLPQAIQRVAEIAELGEDYEVTVFPRPEHPFRFFISLFSAKLQTWISGQPEWLQRWQRRFSLGASLHKPGAYMLMPFSLKVE